MAHQQLHTTDNNLEQEALLRDDNPSTSCGFTRQAWPARAVVTAGMPYGNKPLHFGHIAGVFVPADCYARFLRDRIGRENVIFISGTDCYGSPIVEGYRKARETDGFKGSILQYVQHNHAAQKTTLAAYDISLDLYEGSGFGRTGEIHKELTAWVFNRLHENGHIHLRTTLQFFDTEADTFLNGRQVVGRCPVQGCKSEKAYADECDMGHQFDPEELINPTSTITGQTPEMRPVQNWYFDLPQYRRALEHINAATARTNARQVVSQTVEEFLAAPVIFIKNELEDEYRTIADRLPAHTFHAAEGNKQSFSIEFATIDERDKARDALMRSGCKIRTGKTLTPFRLSGNVEWGVPVPELEGVTGLTCWVWPESLWAPVSFTCAAFERHAAAGMYGAQAQSEPYAFAREQTKRFWCAKDARIYQFIGQDNLYFYGVAQPALWIALEKDDADEVWPAEGQLQQSTLIANHHILFGKTKASSSGDTKPPTGDELLEYYTVEQLRAHWLALGLDQKSVGFKPKPFVASPEQRADPRVADPALKEGALLTNIFNRLARSCLYEAKNNFDGKLPLGRPSEDVRDHAHAALETYDRLMARTELHAIMSTMDDFIRYANKTWASQIRDAEHANEMSARRQALINASYLLWICTLLMHPVVPRGCETICEFLLFDPAVFFSWDHRFDSLEELCSGEEKAAQTHAVQLLPPRFDFFNKHPSQYKK